MLYSGTKAHFGSYIKVHKNGLITLWTYVFAVLVLLALPPALYPLLRRPPLASGRGGSDALPRPLVLPLLAAGHRARVPVLPGGPGMVRVVADFISNSASYYSFPRPLMQQLESSSTFDLNAGAAEKNAGSKNPETFEQNTKEHLQCLILSVFNIFLFLCLYATLCTHVISTYTLVFYSFLQLSAIYNLHQYDDIPLMITE